MEQPFYTQPSGSICVLLSEIVLLLHTMEGPFIYIYRVFFNEESKVSGQKSIQNLVSDANSGPILLVIVANLILYPKIHSEYIFELIISYEKKKVKIWDIALSEHFVVVALVQIVSKKV